MANGDISKRLASEIRDVLNINSSNTLIKNDFLIYNSLDRYQKEFMTNFKTSFQRYTITLSGALTVALDPRLFIITKIYPDLKNLSGDIYQPEYDRNTHSLIFPEGSTQYAGDKIYVEGYIRPAYTTDNQGEPVYDDISDNIDPIIERDYFPLLKDAVWSEYQHINKSFRAIELVRQDVHNLAASLRTEIRANRGERTIHNMII